MTFETKFDLGQKVYPLIRIILPQSCRICDNGILLLANGKELACPECLGTGTITGSVKGVLWKLGPEAVVESVEISRSPPPLATRGETYRFGGSKEWDVEDVFATKESAEIECEKRNNTLQGETE